MPIRFLRALASTCCCLFVIQYFPIAVALGSSTSEALTHSPDINARLSQSLIIRLSEAPEWLNLLHYRQTFFGGYESQVDDTKFFLAKNGKFDAQAELQESITQLFDPRNLSDTHPRCRFIARYFWLSQRLDIDAPDVSACDEYNKWLREINAKSALLVFPAAYLNSPSSMFGHTLLRLDPNDFRKEIPLASYAVNYAAQLVNQDNEFLYAYRGLFGGYPGNFNIVPYHTKIKEYSDLENRDIWEYSLNLNDDEIERMMRHLWELKSIRFDYFFMSENCSYRLLSLLDVARPSLRLSHRFTWRTMPIDTIKAVQDSGLVREIAYRPSQSKLLLQRFELVTEKLKQQVQLLTRPDIELDENWDSNFSAVESARVLELSYDFLRYQSSSVKSEHKLQYQKSYQLLKRRSLIHVDNVWPETNPPEIRSDQGHGSSRVAWSYGRWFQQNYLSFQYRPAYHQELDPDQGFDHGAAINFFNFDFRYRHASRTFDLHRLNVLNIESFTPVNGLFSPWSWTVNLETQKTAISENIIRNIAQFNAGFGKTLSFEQQNKYSLSLLIDNQVFSNSKLEKKAAFGLGPRLHWRLNYRHFTWTSDLSWRKSILGGAIDRKNANIGLASYWSKDNSFRLTWQREYWNEVGSSELQFSVNHYF